MAKFKLPNIGEGLLSDVSKQMAIKQENEIHTISIDLIDTNEENEGFSMDDLEDLAQSILEVGLQQNLVVIKQSDGHYRLTAGHRRMAAIKKLIADGHNKFLDVPCLVKDPATIDLPLSPETKELYLIGTTNLEQRKNTAADLIKLCDMMSKVYDELKNNGYPSLGKRRDYIAERLGVSSSTIKILNYVDKNLVPEFREQLDKDQLPLTVADKIAHLEDKEQAQLHRSTPENAELSVKDVETFAARREQQATHREAVAQTRALNDSPHMIDFSIADFTSQLNSIQEQITDTPELSQKDYTKILEAKRVIEKQLVKINQTLLKAKKSDVPPIQLLLSPATVEALDQHQENTSATYGMILSSAVIDYLRLEPAPDNEIDGRHREFSGETMSIRKTIVLTAPADQLLSQYCTLHGLSKNSVMNKALRSYLQMPTVD